MPDIDPKDAALREAYPNSPEMWGEPTRPAEDPAARAAFPASPEMFDGKPAPAPSPAASTADLSSLGDLRTASERWAAAARADPEISPEDLAAAQELVRAHGDDELRGFLALGYGNHPALIRLLARVARGGRK